MIKDGFVMKKLLSLNKKTVLLQVIYVFLIELISIATTDMTFFKILWIDLGVAAAFAVVTLLWNVNKVNEKVITLTSSAAGIYMGISLVLSYTGRMTKGYPNSFFTSNIIPFVIMILIWLQIRNITKNEDILNKKKILVYISFIIMAFSVLRYVPMVISEIVNSSSSRDFDDVFDKDPNDWTDEEKDYVDDLFDWMDKQNED